MTQKGQITIAHQSVLFTATQTIRVSKLDSIK